MSGTGNFGKQKVGWQLPQAGEREDGEKRPVYRVWDSLWGEENALKLDDSDSHITP